MRTRLLVLVSMSVGVGLWEGCAASPKKAAEPTAPPPAAAADSPAGGADPQAVSAEKMEEIDNYFRRTAGHLQFECYNSYVEQTHRKYEGTVTVQLVILPGGKASQVKLVSSTLASLDKQKEPATAIADCVLENVKSWEWPDVNAPAPYIGGITFKPAW